MTTNLRIRAAVVAAPVAAAAALALASPAAAASVAPLFKAGNPSCADLNGAWTEAKIDANPSAGTVTINGFTVTITKPTTDSLDFSAASADVAAVIMKGGPNANVYAYDPPVRGDSGLVPPNNPNSGGIYGISHVSFCLGAAAPAPTPDPVPAPDPAPQVQPQAQPDPQPQPEVAAAVAASAPEAAPIPVEVLGVQIERPEVEAAAVASEQLAMTGVDTTRLAVVGLALTAIGVALLPLARRRRG